MNKKNSIDPEDKALFRATVRGIQPLKYTKITPLTQPPFIQRKEKYVDELPDFLSDYETLEPVNSETHLYFTRPGIQYKTLRNFRKGQYNVEATLDLHGLTADEARKALLVFLAHCKENKTRHVLIVHGKGRGNQPPVLKNKLNHWLRQTNQVLAFCSAKARDGESGALYLLLKIK